MTDSPVPDPPQDPLRDVLCQLLPHCMRPAAGWLEGVPACPECADKVIEREEALYANPWLKLPDLDDDPFH